MTGPARVALSASATGRAPLALAGPDNGYVSYAPVCEELEAVATDEEQPTSLYVTTKRDQQDLVPNMCHAYGILAVAFRRLTVF